jgi:hypothetical protein
VPHSPHPMEHRRQQTFRTYILSQDLPLPFIADSTPDSS